MADPVTARRAGSLRALSPATRVLVRERRRRLCAGAEGRVLDPTGRAPLTDFRRADDVVSGPDAADRAEGRFDAVVSVMWLSGVADVTAALAGVDRSLGPEGELLFLEPVRDPGLGRIGQGLVSPALQRAAGWRVDRDIPDLLRTAGWAISDLERIPMPAYLWPLHGLVEGRARRRQGPTA